MTANKMVAPNTLSSLNFIPDRGGPYLPPDMTWSPRQGTATTDIHCYDRDALSPISTSPGCSSPSYSSIALDRSKRENRAIISGTVGMEQKLVQIVNFIYPLW